MLTAESLRMSDREIKALKNELGAYNVQNNFKREPMKDALGKNEFLKLLTVQMTKQDPLNPMDNKDMIAQLAQFSALEQMTEVNKSLTSMKTYYDAQNGYSILGKSVEVMDEAGNRFLGPVEMVMKNDTGVALAIKVQGGLMTVRLEDIMMVHSSGDLMASESAATMKILEIQREDEASKVFNSSLVTDLYTKNEVDKIQDEESKVNIDTK